MLVIVFVLVLVLEGKRLPKQRIRARARRRERARLDLIFLLLIFSTALLFGNEFSIGFLIHPSLSRADHRGLLPAIQVFARYFGKIMPVWMVGTLVLHLLLLWTTWQWPAHHTVCLVWAVILWVIVIVFSLVGPVPINNRVKSWDLAHLPDDWEAERRRWDALNAIRVVLIGFAFLALLLAFRSVPISR